MIPRQQVVGSVATQPRLEWVLRYLPNVILDQLDRKGPWLAGGSITRLIAGEEPGDYDLFANRWEDFEIPSEWRMVRESPFAKTYTLLGVARVLTIQTIHRPFTDLPSVLNSFDFTVRQFGTDGKTVWAGLSSEKDVKYKKLAPNPSQEKLWTPSSTLVGITRYSERGYKMSYSAARDFMKQWNVAQGENTYYTSEDVRA